MYFCMSTLELTYLDLALFGLILNCKPVLTDQLTKLCINSFRFNREYS